MLNSVEVFTIQVVICTNVSVQGYVSLLYFTKMYIFLEVAIRMFKHRPKSYFVVRVDP